MDKRIKVNLFSGPLVRIFVFALIFILSSASPARADILDDVGDIIGDGIAMFNSFLNDLMSVINDALALAGQALADALSWLPDEAAPWVNAFLDWLFGTGTCGETATPTGDATVGRVICNVIVSSEMLPGFISGIGYLIGLICAVTGLLKLKDHVINPNGTPLSDSMRRFVAGGAFFALPMVTTALKNTIIGSDGVNVLSPISVTALEGATAGGYGLDTLLVIMMADIMEPLVMLFRGFCYLAGLVLVVVGLGRIVRASQEGPRGPSGIGTIMTFLTAGALFSLDELLGSFASSLFGQSVVKTYPILDQSTGDATVDAHVEAVISAVVAFVFVIGWVSFIRGFFIMREVAEGSGQGSMMAGLTHIFGGAVAVNLGPMLNAVQSTFGLTGFGVSFN